MKNFPAKSARNRLLVKPLVLFVLLSLAFSLVWAGWLRNHFRNDENFGPTGSLSYPDKECGPKALLLALSRLGYPLRQSEIDNECKPGKRGASFKDLLRTARKKGFEANLAQLTWEKLTTLNATAVLWINENHFVAIDPREDNTLENGQKRTVRVYDDDVPARWWTKEQLREVWRGETLVLKRSSHISKDSGGPRISWTECTRDFGFLDHQTTTRHKFEFENTGCRPLQLRVASVACGCSTAKLSVEELEPGERGHLEVAVKLKGKRGFFSSHVAVKSNDPKQTMSFLHIRGGVHNKEFLSTRTIYFGDIQRGKSARKGFVVYDIGDSSLQVTDARIVWDPQYTSPWLPNTKVGFSRMENHDPASLRNHGLKSRDYYITIDMYADPNCPLGEFSGDVLVSTNLPADMSELSVRLKASIVGDVISKPKAVLLMPHKNDGICAEIELESLSGAPIRLVNATADGDLSINRVVAFPGENHLFVKAHLVRQPETDSVTCGDLLFATENNGTIRVPVVIYYRNK